MYTLYGQDRPFLSVDRAVTDHIDLGTLTWPVP